MAGDIVLLELKLWHHVQHSKRLLVCCDLRTGLDHMVFMQRDIIMLSLLGETHSHTINSTQGQLIAD